MPDFETSRAALAAQARAAFARHDHAEALRHWALFHALHPGVMDGYLGLAETLRERRHFVAAEHFSTQGMAAFPDVEWLPAAHAWISAHQGQWPLAEQRFRSGLERFPNSISLRFGLGLALNTLSRRDEAEAVLLPILDAQPDVPTLRLLADIAGATGRAALAVERWQALLVAQSDTPENHLGLASALRGAQRDAEAEQVLADALARFPEDARLLRGLARQAEQAGDLPLALRRWEAFKTLFGSLPDGYLGAARVLHMQGRPADAEVVLAPAAKLFRDDLAVLTLHAQVANQASRWADAAARWQAVVALSPDQPEGYLGALVALQGGGNTTAAAAMLAEAEARFPDNLRVASEAARMVQARGHAAEAPGAWQAVVARFPNAPQPRAELVRALARAERFAEAEAAAAEALALSPGLPELLQAQAEAATAQGDHALAEQRWAALVQAAPALAPGIIGLARAQLAQGKAEAATALLAAAVERLPASAELQLENARLASDLRDWPRALPLWLALGSRHGARPHVRAALERAVAAAQQDMAVAEAAGTPAPFAIPPELLRMAQDEATERSAAKALLMRFESLGSNCEFGIVQRRFGAEPLGLLRWTGTPPGKLAAAFRNGLAGVGEPEHTTIHVTNGEYITNDTRYHMASHTFSQAALTPEDKFLAAHCKRMVFLRGKLLQDLATAEKVFTYGHPDLPDAVMDELFEAIRTQGPAATLLCVRLAGVEHPPGTVQVRRPGLLVGAVQRFSNVDTAFDDWLAVCREAVALLEAGAGVVGEAAG